MNKRRVSSSTKPSFLCCTHLNARRRSLKARFHLYQASPDEQRSIFLAPCYLQVKVERKKTEGHKGLLHTPSVDKHNDKRNNQNIMFERGECRI